MCTEILPYLDIQSSLAWSCTCRFTCETCLPHLRQEYNQLQKDLKILSWILTDHYFREALNLVTSVSGSPGDNQMASDVLDLDIVLMRAGDVDGENASERLSATEKERLETISAVTFEAKQSCAILFLALGYEVEMCPCGSEELDYPMRVINNGQCGRYSSATAITVDSSSESSFVAEHPPPGTSSSSVSVFDFDPM